MNIIYLNKMLEYPKVDDVVNAGVSEEEINEVEKKIGFSFGKVYREFLLIAGLQSNLLSYQNHSLRYAIERQNRVKSFLKEEKLSIEGGKLWVICDLDGGEQFDFFYFNDPDAEDVENPPVYASYPGYLEEGAKLKEKIADSFSQYINDKIKAYTEDS